MISRDQEEKLRLMSEHKAQVTRQAEIVDAKRAGRLEEKREIAKSALANGLPLAVISSITGLSIESITTLKTSAEG
jgi:predicted transposase/invertase (TIGR01784 family)